MAPVIVELGAQSGLVIPLIGVHLFVFYYGIMGDITPPVGLASFATAAIARKIPLRSTCRNPLAIRRTWPALHLDLQPRLLLIDVHGIAEVLLVATAATIASLLFVAATMGWFRTKTRWWEIGLLLAACFIMYRPDWFADQVAPEYVRAPASKFYETVARLDEGDRVVFRIQGQTLEGDDKSKTVALQLGPKVDDPNVAVAARKRLADAGLGVSGMGEMLQVSSVRFGSRAAKSRIEQGYDIVGVELPSGRLSAAWFYIPGVLLAALIWWMQGLRMRRAGRIAEAS